MAGTIPLSLTQQFDEFGKPLSGALLYIIQAGTVSTPQQPYQDASLTILQPNPIQLDAAGRVPQFFLADGYIKVRLDDKFGVTQLARDGILVIGPSAGGGGGGGVDPTTLIQTGAIQPFYGTGVLAGFVRMNGRTIGSATSGASERANSDCQALFNFLWNVDSALVVAPSRGASSAADWAANKTIAVPDWRGYGLGALDDMGNVAAGRLTAAYFGTAATVLGAGGGAEFFTLTASHIPASGLAVSGTTSTDFPDHTHAYTYPPDSGARVSGTGNILLPSIASSSTGGASARHQHNFSANLVGGGGNPHRAMGPLKLCTLYIKL
ncbi:hypothetical protein ACM41_24280 [Bradyrhizobium sp. CCBAU 21362]|uniref:hypothetical protein n=1 Tax=Bradyrhizobium sp. CCBAU 21362 TaxID=1325082 RepID=UPI0023054719|nr:hypothetical protein [Bradyrhizobium sp. CCBAU 21362]MDA9539222.1 hypothetical protein [Bradyrhizobium sp. CCBAU 21362]